MILAYLKAANVGHWWDKIEAAINPESTDALDTVNSGRRLRQEHAR